MSKAFAEGTFEAAIGIGSVDSIRLYDKGGNLLDAYSWTEHASYDGDPAKASYGRYPDGTGGFQDFAAATKGTKNKVVNPVVINEVQSNDPGGGPDWVELANPTAEALDLSGLVLKDNMDKDPYTIPEGTTIPANGYLVICQDDSGAAGFAFGLGKGDSVRLFEAGEQIAIATWLDGSHMQPVQSIPCWRVLTVCRTSKAGQTVRLKTSRPNDRPTVQRKKN